jgi:hypothetical protein
MNVSIGNQSYAVKRARFAKDSKFKDTREFSATHEEWNRQRLKRGANDLAARAKNRFPHHRPAQTFKEPNPLFD